MAIQLSGSLAITGSLVATSQIVAQTLNVQQVTSSIVYSSGSNIFGNSVSNTQQFTGSLQVSGSTSYILGNVGIGTTSPATLLHIASSGNTFLTIDGGASSNTGVAFYKGGSAAGAIYYLGASDAMRFDTSNTERMRITSTGISCFACQVCVPNIISTGASGGRYATFNAPTNGGYITFEAGGTAFGDLGSYCAQYGTGDATTLSLQSRTGYALALGTNSTEKVRIDTTGNLMVGSVSAGNAGSINVSVGCAGTTAGGLQLWATNAQTHYVQFGDGTAGAGPYAGYVGYAHSTDSLLLGAGAATRAIISSAGVACFSSTICASNAIFSTAGTPSLFNTNITSTLDFNATSRSGFTGLTDNCNGVYFGMGADALGISAGIGFFRESSGWNSALAFYTNCITDGVTVPRIQEKMRITSCGNVGIGTASPVGKLDVALLNTRRFIVTYDDSIITIKGASDTGAGENLRIIGDNLIFNTNSVGSGSERMRITSGGNVLIGTTCVYNTANFIVSAGSGASSTPYMGLFNCAASPTVNASTRLDLGFLSGNSDFVATNTILGYINFMGQANDAGYGGAGIYAQVVSGGNVGRTSGHGVNLIFNTKATNTAGYNERLRITSDGSVGIGTTSPGTSKLYVSGDATNYGITSEAPSGYGKLILKQTSGQAWSVGLSSNDLFFYYGGASAGTRVTFANGGNVGIGTTAPNAKLNIQDGFVNVGSSANVTTANTLLAGYGYILSGTTYGNVKITSNYSNVTNQAGLEFYTDNGTSTERMRITSGGNVGIGTTAPGAILTVYNSAVSSTSGQETLRIMGSYDGTVVGSGPTIQFTDSSGGGTGAIKSMHEAGSAVVGLGFFTLSSTQQERMRITSAGIACFACTVCTPRIVAGEAILGNSYTCTFPVACVGGTYATVIPPNTLNVLTVYLAHIYYDNGTSSPYTANTAFIFKTTNTNGGGTDNAYFPMTSTHQGGTGCWSFRTIAGTGQVSSGLQIQAHSFANNISNATLYLVRLA